MDTYAPRTLEQVAAASAAAAAARTKSTHQNANSATGTPNSNSKKKKPKNGADGNGAERADGRTLTQMRPTFLQVGLITAAAGSAYVERQGTKVICAIYGPRASKKFSTPFSERGQFLVDFKYAPFAQTVRRGKRPGAGGNQYELEEKEITQQLTEALAVSIHLEAFPKAVLEAYVQVLQDEGGVLSSALTCVSLALANAGVMLYDLVTACEALSLDNTLYLDPSAAEAQAGLDAQSAEPASSSSSSANTPSAGLLLAYMPSLKQITAITQTGNTTVEQVKQLTHMCIAGCEQLNGLMRECLVEAAKKKAQLQTPSL